MLIWDPLLFAAEYTMPLEAWILIVYFWKPTPLEQLDKEWDHDWCTCSGSALWNFGTTCYFDVPDWGGEVELAQCDGCCLSASELWLQTALGWRSWSITRNECSPSHNAVIGNKTSTPYVPKVHVNSQSLPNVEPKVGILHGTTLLRNLHSAQARMCDSC